MENDVVVSNCVTCTCRLHKGSQYPRPACVHLYFSDDNWAQICEECWIKLKKIVDKSFDDNHKAWCNFMKRAVEESKDESKEKH